MIASCGFLEDELRQFSGEEGATIADPVESLGRRPNNESQKVGSERKSEEALSVEDVGVHCWSTP